LKPKRTVVDLLDDWTVHPAFAGIRPSVLAAYETVLAEADVVIANAEGTMALARRFGRGDAVLITNGCDPSTFKISHSARGPLTVGYIGKLGLRLDYELVERSVQACPNVSFVFAGPFMDRMTQRFLRRLPLNASCIGDVHYTRIPMLLSRFDVGWIPHRVGAGEIGGDAIKLYEYRAAGLPVLTTSIMGVASRGLSAVTVVRTHEEIVHYLNAARKTRRVPRVPEFIAPEMTWKQKAERFMGYLGLQIDPASPE
jgi:glycosyltransferase involved in cell wall biosynthesis